MQIESPLFCYQFESDAKSLRFFKVAFSLDATVISKASLSNLLANVLRH